MFYNSFRRCRSRLALLALLALAAGCTSAPIPVEGRLQWQDGKPVTSANVRFVPVSGGSPDAVGVTDDQGAFTLTSVRGPGAVPGDYKVVVTKIGSTGTTKGDAPKSGEDIKSGEDMIKGMKGTGEKSLKGRPPGVTDPVPGIYATEDTTPLTWKVEAGKKVELTINRK